MKDLILQVLRWPHLLWEIDPGYFKLKHSVKTIVGILVALLLTTHEPMTSRLMASVACGVSMQGVIAKPFLSRILQVMTFSLFYFTAFMAGLAVRDSATDTSIVLIFMAFSVNYLRRYDLQTSLAPMMAWLLCFMATMLPFTNTDTAYENIQGFVIGLMVSVVMTLLIFPDNYPRLFIANSNRLFLTMVKGLTEIRWHMRKTRTRRHFDKLFFKQCRLSLTRLVDSNQVIEQAPVFGDKQKIITDVLIHQYALVNAYLMMMEAYQSLFKSQRPLPIETRMALSDMAKQFAQLFESLKMDKHYQLTVKKSLVSLIQFTEKLGRNPVTEPALVIDLLNLKLSFILFNQHIEKLSGVRDDA